jgi:hypothetical protein
VKNGSKKFFDEICYVYGKRNELVDSGSLLNTDVYGSYFLFKSKEM